MPVQDETPTAVRALASVVIGPNLDAYWWKFKWPGWPPLDYGLNFFQAGQPDTQQVLAIGQTTTVPKYIADQLVSAGKAVII